MLTRVGKGGKSLGLIVDADVGVPHRHLDVGMSGQLACFRETGSVSEQFRDVSVASGRMKVRHACRRDVWNARLCVGVHCDRTATGDHLVELGQMILRLSQKLNTKIKAGKLTEMLLDENPYTDWSCHLFTADRTQYILLSNTASLYSCVMFGKGITDYSRFIERAGIWWLKFIGELPDLVVGLAHSSES